MKTSIINICCAVFVAAWVILIFTLAWYTEVLFAIFGGRTWAFLFIPLAMTPVVLMCLNWLIEGRPSHDR